VSPAVHVVQAAVSGAALYPFIGMNAVPFALSVVLIDLDHIIEYIADTGDWTLRGFFVFYEVLLKNLDKGYFGLSLFHTVESYAAGILLAQWFPIFYYIVLGCVFHHLFDLVFLYRHGIPFAKSLSVIHYFLNRKRSIVSIRQVLRQDGVNIEGIRTIGIWKARWGVE
jgi:hypothetical protein